MFSARIASAAPVVVPLLIALVATGACGNARANAQFIAASTPPRPPAAVAGGACYLLEYEAVERIVGTSFDVSASSMSMSTETFTCVLQASSGSYPDLTLAVTPLAGDSAMFKSTVAPKGSAAVTALGKAGYSRAVPAGAGAGPGVEVGWLSGNGRLLVLRYRCPSEVTAEEVGALTPKLVALAKEVEQKSR
jgi:hypothetical protein